MKRAIDLHEISDYLDIYYDMTDLDYSKYPVHSVNERIGSRKCNPTDFDQDPDSLQFFSNFDRGGYHLNCPQSYRHTRIQGNTYDMIQKQFRLIIKGKKCPSYRDCDEFENEKLEVMDRYTFMIFLRTKKIDFLEYDKQPVKTQIESIGSFKLKDERY